MNERILRALDSVTAERAHDAVLTVRGLTVRFHLRGGRTVAAVTDAAFDLAPGECLALVGESGCGKSVLASALLGLLPRNAETEGTAWLAGGTPAGDGSGALDLLAADERALDLLAADERTLARVVRGRRIGLVPQSPAAHLTPVRTVRAHLEETVRALTGTPRRARRAAAEAAAERAAFPVGHLDRYPHELSGGLAQRAATALALIGDAPVLLADEPTTGLDRELVDRTADELRRHVDTGKALLLVTHDLAAARRVADRVAVMYAGRIVEIAPAARFFGRPGPRHPYARGLLNALPEREFTPIPGLPPELSRLPEGCAFAPRCARATGACAARPDLRAGVACHHPQQDAGGADRGPQRDAGGTDRGPQQDAGGADRA
ncbi:ABC transporter ATP-binding protein [Streptomyces sp. NPDC004788]